MKIGIDCRLWSETGVGRYIRNLVLNLQKIDSKNTYILFVLSKDRDEILKQVEDTRRNIQDDTFKIIEVDIRWHSIKEQLRFASILSYENLDLMHFPYISVPLNYQKPFVVTIHDLIPYYYPTSKASTLPAPIYFLKLLAYKYILKQAVNNAKKIISVSNMTKDEIIKHFRVYSEKIVVTYEGVDKNVLGSKSESPNIQLKKYFLYVGNAYPHKNLDSLLDAFKIFSKEWEEAQLIFVGKEDYFYKRLKEKVRKLKLNERVVFMENIDDSKLSALYKNAVATIMPSFMEGFGLPALEAMANKCLVLASNIPSLKEICGDAALYFDPNNIDDIRNKMKIAFVGNVKQNSINIERGVEIANSFSWEKMAKETLSVYEQSVSNP